MKVSSGRYAILSLRRQRRVRHIVFAGCFVSMFAISQPAPAQDTTAHANALPARSNKRPEKSARPTRPWDGYYVRRRWGHEVQKRQKKHCIGYVAGECLVTPAIAVGYALQDYSGGSSSPVLLEICGGALGLAGLGAGFMYLGCRHEARHPNKFIYATTIKKRKSKRGKL